jgi:hypothetical protein
MSDLPEDDSSEHGMEQLTEHPEYQAAGVAAATEQQAHAARCAVSRGSALWAVSVVLTLNKPDGKINIMNHLLANEASSRDEAVGKAIARAMETSPQHQVHCFTAVQIAEPNK